MALPLAVPLVLGGLGLAGKAFNYFGADSDQDEAQRQLNELSKQPYSKFSANPALMSFYSRMLNRANNPVGMTAAEKAGANKRISDTISTNLYNARGLSGGNLTKAIGAAGIAPTIAAGNEIAINDARLRQGDERFATGALGTVTNQLQSIDNMNIQQDLNRRYRTEDALGRAVQQNKAFKSNTIDSIGSDLIGGGLMLGMGSMGAGGDSKTIPLAGVRNTINDAFSSPNTSYGVNDKYLKGVNPLMIQKLLQQKMAYAAN